MSTKSDIRRDTFKETWLTNDKLMLVNNIQLGKLLARCVKISLENIILHCIQICIKQHLTSNNAYLGSKDMTKVNHFAKTKIFRFLDTFYY